MPRILDRPRQRVRQRPAVASTTHGNLRHQQRYEVEIRRSDCYEEQLRFHASLSEPERHHRQTDKDRVGTHRREHGHGAPFGRDFAQPRHHPEHCRCRRITANEHGGKTPAMDHGRVETKSGLEKADGHQQREKQPVQLLQPGFSQPPLSFQNPAAAHDDENHQIR